MRPIGKSSLIAAGVAFFALIAALAGGSSLPAGAGSTVLAQAVTGADAASRPAGEDESGAGIMDSPKIIQPQWTKEDTTHAPRTQPGQVVDIRARVYCDPRQGCYCVGYEASGGRTPGGKIIKPPQPQQLLQCELLEKVEKYAVGSPPPLLKLSGETFWYHKMSFLLLREVITDTGDVHASPPTRPAVGGSTPLARTGANTLAEISSTMPVGVGSAGGAEAVRPKPLIDLADEANKLGGGLNGNPGSGPAGNGASGAPATRANMPSSSSPASGASSRPAPIGPDSGDILQRLASERPGRNLGVIAAPASAPAAVTSVAPPSAEATITTGAGPMVADRIVLFSYDANSGWWMVHFLGDNTLREPPMRLLACELLEEAEGLITQSQARLKFRISGEKTLYHGRRYLLLRKMTVERDLGQL